MSILEFRKKLYLTIIIFYIREVFEILGVKRVLYEILVECMCVT